MSREGLICGRVSFRGPADVTMSFELVLRFDLPNTTCVEPIQMRFGVAPCSCKGRKGHGSREKTEFQEARAKKLEHLLRRARALRVLTTRPVRRETPDRGRAIADPLSLPLHYLKPPGRLVAH